MVSNLCRPATWARKVSAAFWLLALIPPTVALSCRTQPQSEKVAAPAPTPQATALINPPGFPPTVLGKPYPGTGIITVINFKEGWVTIEHEEIKDLMPTMTMEFWVRNRSIMKRVRVGDKVDFVVVEDGKGQYLAELKRVRNIPLKQSKP